MAVSNTTLQERIDYIREEYSNKLFFPYDLATDLLNDYYTDDLDDLIDLVSGATEKDCKEDVISAFDDFEE